MKKVAIVGVEGSGKTVMLAGLGELYMHPDESGCFLAPKNFTTAKYVSEKIARMRRGEWPIATASDVLQGLDWTLRQRNDDGQRPQDVCEVSCLDFAGEVYRLAFGIRQGNPPPDLSDEVTSLKNYIREASDLIILINLRDIIVNGQDDPHVQESMWITNEILSYAFSDRAENAAPRATIVLSQADSYAGTINACGGPKGVLRKYLPHVANNYDWLDVLEVSAVDQTRLDDDGNVVPAPDFRPVKLRPIMDWILSGIENISVKVTPVNFIAFCATLLAVAVAMLMCLLTGHWGVSIPIGLFSLLVLFNRGERDVKQTTGAWLLFAAFVLAAGGLGESGHWVFASGTAFAGYCMILK